MIARRICGALRSALPLPFALIVFAAGLTACGGSGSSGDQGAEGGEPESTPGESIVVVLPSRGQLVVLDPGADSETRFDVGESPWGVAVDGERAYVSAAQHVAVVDLEAGRVVARVPYLNPPEGAALGEDRPGGMGIALDPKRERAYVGVNGATGERGRIEVLDIGKLEVADSVPVGDRPFDVLVDPSADAVYSVDHDSYGVTAVDARTLESRFLPVAPLGRGAFDKLNYGAIDMRGQLLLPVNGEVLAVLDPRSGSVEVRPMSSDVHQAGVTLAAGQLLTVGAESLNGGSPNLSIYDLRSGEERVIPLERPHEDVVATEDGRTAYLSGGYTRGGWEGITELDLDSGRSREIKLDAEPLGIAALGATAR